MPAIAGTAVVVVVEFPDSFQAFLFDEGQKKVKKIYEQKSKGKNFRVDVVEWSIANEIYFYEYFDRPIQRLLGETIKLTVFPRATINLTQKYGVRGRPRSDPQGKRALFLEGPVETKGVPYSLILLDLKTGKPATVFSRFGTRQIVFEGQPTMWSTLPVWLRDEKRVVFVDTDHAVEIPPNLMIWDVTSKKKTKELRIGAAGKGLDCRLGWDDQLYILVRELKSKQYALTQVNHKTGIQKKLTTFPGPIQILGTRP